MCGHFGSSHDHGRARLISYDRGDQKLAVVTIGRGRESLEAEAAFERFIAAQQR